MVQRPARHVQQLERFVEARGVGRAGRADREHALERLREQFAAHHAFTRAHPVLVALHGVDLTVVREHPVRVRERPRRERVGAEPRVHEAQRGLEAVVLEVAVERLELTGREHALVDDDPGRQRREVGVGVVLDALAGHVHVAFEVGAREPVLGHEHLAERGQHLAGARAGHVRADRHVPPAEDREPFVGEDLLGVDHRGLDVVAGQERDAGRVLTRGREVEVHDRAVQTVGQLHEDAGAVAGVGLGAGRAAVVQVAQRGEGLVHERRLRRPCMSTTKPTPQLSCSKRGS